MPGRRSARAARTGWVRYVPVLFFLTARSCQSEFGCAVDEKLFTVAAAFNRPRDPCDPFLLCASNPLGGCALWVAQSVASPSKMHEWVERSEKRARLAARPPRQSDFRGRPQTRSAARWASSS